MTSRTGSGPGHGEANAPALCCPCAASGPVRRTQGLRAPLPPSPSVSDSGSFSPALCLSPSSVSLHLPVSISVSLPLPTPTPLAPRPCFPAQEPQENLCLWCLGAKCPLSGFIHRAGARQQRDPEEAPPGRRVAHQPLWPGRVAGEPHVDPKVAGRRAGPHPSPN